jgi:hypothetical protein
MTMPDDPLSMKNLEKTLISVSAYASMSRDRLRAHNEVCMSLRTNLYSKNDLTPRQIEWCRAWIPAFNPKVTP